MEAAQETDTALRRARKSKGLTQDQLAQRSRCAQATISALERGEWSPTLAVAMRLSAALGAEPGDLFPEVS